MKRPKISVIMPFYDGGDRLKRKYCLEAIESVLAQTFKNFEILFVVSGKKDFAEKVSKKSKKIRVIHVGEKIIGRPGGATQDYLHDVVRARNAGIANAKGEFVACADCDDICYPTRLSKQHEFMEKHHEIGIIGSAMELVDKDGKHEGAARNYEQDEEIRRYFLRNAPFFHPTVFARTKLLRELGGYSTCEPVEDLELWIRVMAKTRGHNLQLPLIKYRQGEGAGTYSRYINEYKSSELRLRFRAVRELGIGLAKEDWIILCMGFVTVFWPTFKESGMFNALKSVHGALFSSAAAK